MRMPCSSISVRRLLGATHIWDYPQGTVCAGASPLHCLASDQLPPTSRRTMRYQRLDLNLLTALRALLAAESPVVD